MKKTIRILIVDDSSLVLDFLSYIFTSEDDIIVVGTAKNGKEAIKMNELKKPDLITMDMHMPVMNGLEATRTIMETRPVPIVIITSSYDPADVNKTFNAMQAGALAIIDKPVGFHHPDFPKVKRELLETIRSMAEVRVVTRRAKYKKKTDQTKIVNKAASYSEKKTKYKITAIGVSTGGPQILNIIIPRIPKNYSMPIVIVQHIADGFLEGMIEWLSKSTELTIKIAENGELLKKGTIYFCPSDYNIGIKENLMVELKKEVPGFSIRPSVSYLFRTIGRNFKHESIGVLLSGMGKDGAEELALMKESGAITIVQDKDSCIVFGMPAEAIKLDAHKYILPPEKIVEKLIELDGNV